MAHDPNFPVFADRYRFEEAVSHDWDRGRSGSTDLVYDLKEKRLGVIKRVEIIPSRTTEGLKNEIKALKALDGLGVPEVYDTGRAVYGSKNYDYMVIEFIDGIRVEKSLASLSVVERAEIITKLFVLLSKAHQKGIVNGDVDLKHLFWRRDKRQLVVIDWGNARLGVDPKKKTEFAYDLARAAEIIFSLVTQQGHPPATGSISLPDNSALIVGLGPLPLEFYDLCKWAPRTPSDGARAPYTPRELFEVSKKWLNALGGSKPYVPSRRVSKRPQLVRILLFGFISFTLLAIFSFLVPSITSTSVTPTSTFTETLSPLQNTNAPVLTQTISQTIIPTEPSILTPVVPPPLGEYFPIVTFGKEKSGNCGVNEAVPPAKLVLNDGFFRRTDGDWGFRVQEDHPIEDIVQVDFGQCLGDGHPIGALALNVAINQLETPRYESAREFGIFIENQDGERREYMFWLDKDKVMYLRIRENNKGVKDYPIHIINPARIFSVGNSPPSWQFPIQIFLEINNDGFDSVYLLESSLEKSVTDIDPSQMIPIDEAVLHALGDIQKIGLVGRGGETKTLIWPLTLLERKPQ